MRSYGTIPTSFWPDDMGALIKGNSRAIAMICYLMSSPHSNMIGIYRLPIDYVQYDTGFSESVIREAFSLLAQAEFAFYDESAKIVYIPSFAATQIAPSLKPKDSRINAIQRELEKTSHTRFRDMFLKRYASLYHLDFDRGATGGEPGGSGGVNAPSTGRENAKKTGKPVDNYGGSTPRRRGFGPDPVLGSVGVKRGPGREEETNAPFSKAKQFFESWPEYMTKQGRKIH